MKNKLICLVLILIILIVAIAPLSKAVFTTADRPYDIKFKEITANNSSVLAFDDSENLWAWGGNNYGEFGNGTKKSSAVPIQINTPVKFIKVKLESDMAMGIDESGNLWSWGYNYYGKLGNATEDTESLVPTKITSGTKFTDIAFGSTCAIALDSAGNIWGWGRNANGSLMTNIGNKTTLVGNEKYQDVPVKLTSGTVYKSIDMQKMFGAAIDSDNNLWMWGSNQFSQLARTQEEINYSDTPIQIKSGTKFSKVVLGYSSAVWGLDTDGNLWGWGRAAEGAIGISNPTRNEYYSSSNYSITQPVLVEKNVIDVSDCMLITAIGDTISDGWICAWGSNSAGQYGNGTTTESTKVKKIFTNNPLNLEYDYFKDQYRNFTSATRICNNTFAFDSNGDLWMWGRNIGGQLADGTTTNALEPVQITGTKSTFTVTFKNGTETVDTQTVASGSDATAPSLTKAGYTLSWDKSFTNVTSDLTVNAVWTANTNTSYKVQHYKQNTLQNGYELTETENLTGTTDSQVTAAAKSYTGFTQNTTTSSRVPSGTIAGDGSLVLKLYYDRNNYHVALNANNGIINSGNVTSYVYGVGATLPTNITKAGYTFAGWYENSTFSGSQVTSITATEINDKTYYAKWNINSYTVTFKNGTETAKTENVNYGSGATAPSLTKAGYTLSWDKSFSNVTSDLTVNAVWTAKTDTAYKVEHYKQNTSLNGYDLSETENLIGTTDQTVIATAKSYTGFIQNLETADRVPSGTISGDESLVLKLYYDRNSYNVILNTNEGTINAGNVTNYTYGIEAILPTDVTKTGYTFGGWFESNTFSGSAITSISTNSTGDKTYYAKWNINSYTVTFKNGTETAKTENVNYGSGATAPSLTKAGYTLSWDKSFSNVTSDLTVNAVWTAATGTVYKVQHYKQNTGLNGYALAETENLAGTTDNEVTATAKTYEGFSENTSTTNRVPSGTIAGDGSLVLKLYYDRNTYNVILNANEGTIDFGNVTSYKYGIGATLPTSVTKTGHAFDGWYENSTFTGSVVTNISTTETGDKTYYAKWKINQYTVIFKDGENTVKTQKVDYQAAAEAPELTKPGYTLDWDQDFNSVESDMTVEAIWAANIDTPYKVEHYKQNTSLNGYDLFETQNQTGVTDQTATAEAKTYEGFTENTSTTNRVPSGTIAGDGSLVLKLYYDRNSYQVILSSNQGTINTGNVTNYTYGIGAILPIDVTKAGYTFDGWYNNSDLTGTAVTNILPTDIGAKVYYANWNINSYTVTFKNEDIIEKTESVNYGSSATAPNLSRPGYTLSWDKNFSNITEDLEVNAVWTANTNTAYKVEHYKQNTSLNGYDLSETENLIGTTDQTVIATAKSYTEFTQNLETADRVPSGTVEGDGSLVLKLYYNRNSYNVTLNTNKGTINAGNITNYTYGIGAILPIDVTKAGYTFDGWYNNSDLTGTAATNILPTDIGAKVYYANWNINSYTVTFKNEDIIEKTESVNYGSSATAPNLSRPGYTLSWDKNFSNITEDLEVNAIWTVNTNTAYKVEHYKQNTNLNGYDLSETENLVGTTEQTVIAKAKSYTGFTQNLETAERISSGTILGDGSLVLKLYYDRNSYNVILNTNEGTINTGNLVSYVYGVGATLPTNITKTGYVFGGWYDNSIFSGESIATIRANETGERAYYAKWSLAKYTVTFKDGTNVVDTQTIGYGAGATAPTITKTGYTLSWDKPFDNITEDITINAIWTINQYTVTFKDRGTIIDTQTVNYGGKVTAPQLDRENYTLSWDKELTNISQNLEVNAVWTLIPYWLRSDIYDIDSVCIGKVSPETTKEEFVSHLETNGNIVKVTNAKGEELESDGIITTASTLYIEYEGQQYEHKIAVLGDLDDNGKVTITDLSVINQALTGGITLDTLHERAGDLDYNKKMTVTDLSMINQAMVGAIEL